MRLIATAWIVRNGDVAGRMVASETGYTSDDAEQQERFRELIRDRWLEHPLGAAGLSTLEFGPVGQSWAEQRGA